MHRQDQDTENILQCEELSLFKLQIRNSAGNRPSLLEEREPASAWRFREDNPSQITIVYLSGNAG
jgi:hypothetical protein